MNIYTLHFDGSCGPKNPGGTAAYGYTLTKDGAKITEGHEVIGTDPSMSNNLAEFAGLAAGLKQFTYKYTGGQAVLNVRGDSQLVVNIMTRRWKPKPDKLYYPAYLNAYRWLKAIRNSWPVIVNFDWIPREQNQECDTLSKWDKLSQSPSIVSAPLSC